MNNFKILLSSTLLPIAVSAQNNDRPNIVVILADDLLRNELSCYGGENVVTKNIDKLASEGMLFNHNYASEAISAPVRASLYTGLFPARNGTYYNHKPLFANTKTVNDFMPELGYRVARTGKQHTTPVALYKFNDLKGFPKACSAKRVAPTSTTEIENFMSESDEPFLLYVCSINPHAPWTLGDKSQIDTQKIKLPNHILDSPEMRELYADYLAEVMVLDNEVALVRASIEKVGKSENTMILFMGENGSQFPGGKWSCWGAGTNSALIAYYPPMIQAGVKSDAIVQYEDALPTFIDIAGGEVEKNLDGKSFKKVLQGTSKTHRDWAYLIFNNQPEGRPYSVRGIRNEKYSLIKNIHHENEYLNKHIMGGTDGKKTREVSLTWQAWQAAKDTDVRYESLTKRYLKREPLEFYDLKKDPDELNNLASDKRYSKTINKMLSELDKWMLQQDDTGAKFDTVK